MTIVIVAIVLIVLIGAAVVVTRQRRSQQLKRGFGPEYDRTLEERGGDRREAEAELRERQERHRELDLRSLSSETRNRYVDRWRDVQARFVDDPGESIADADLMIQAVMRELGYPVDEFEQRAADISVDHPEVVSNYRAAHGISIAHERGSATTDDLRQALIHYRALFNELLETAATPAG